MFKMQKENRNWNVLNNIDVCDLNYQTHLQDLYHSLKRHSGPEVRQKVTCTQIRPF